MAQRLRKTANQQDDDYWAEKQAPEDRQSATEDAGRNDAHGAGVREAFLSSLRRARATGQPRVSCKAVHHVAITTDEAKETAETKGELSREDVATSCKACKTHIEDGPQLTSQRSEARSRTPAGNARQCDLEV